MLSIVVIDENHRLEMIKALEFMKAHYLSDEPAIMNYCKLCYVAKHYSTTISHYANKCEYCPWTIHGSTCEEFFENELAKLDPYYTENLTVNHMRLKHRELLEVIKERLILLEDQLQWLHEYKFK